MQTFASTSVDAAIQAQVQNSVVKSQRRNKIIYWTLTLVMFLPATAGAVVEAFTHGPASIVKIMIALGYPLYLMKPLGVAKIFGGIATSRASCPG
ncbi:hypothetical protein [Granulicella arctica]|uniref:hypothetical protein n=1 Tax=Granulicella arctica TaxID=940613 RepID=UPI0021DF9834|nr:hypothetical protein [Granulicella arctica]